MKKGFRILLAFFSCLMLASPIMWGQFTAGNLSLLRVGDGTTALSSEWGTGIHR